MDYTKIEVGKPLEGVQGREDGCVFDISDSGAVLYVYYGSPSSEEIKNFSAGSVLEARYVVLDGEIYLLFKFGSEEWMDLPYNPHLSRQLTKLPVIQDSASGLGLTIILADTHDGVVKVLRFVALANDFSKRLMSEVWARSIRTFDDASYKNSIFRERGKYSSKRMATYAVARCRISQ